MIADNADDLLGSEGNRYFRHLSPVDMINLGGLTTTDKARHLESLLEQDQRLGEVAARGATNELREVQANRSLTSIREESATLQALNQLDPFEDGFADKATGFTQMAALNPVVGRALDQKMRSRKGYSDALQDHTASAIEAGLTEEEFATQQTTAKDLLRRGDVEGYSGLIQRNARLREIKDNEAAEKSASMKFQQEQFEAGRESELERMKDRQAMDADHRKRLAGMDLPYTAMQTNPDFFQDEMAGDPERLPLVVNQHVTDSLLSSQLEGRSDFRGLPILDHLVSRVPEGGDLRSMLSEDGEAQHLLQTFARDAASMDEDRFIATYSAELGSEDSNGEFVGTTKEEVARTEDFLSGIHAEVRTINEFSREKELYRGNDPELAQRAQAVRAKRIEAAKAESRSKAEAMRANMAAIMEAAL